MLSLSALEKRIGYRFQDLSQLQLAVTHRSWCAENGGQSNERLEFFGDAVLALAVADLLYHHFDDLSEGQMAKARAAVVNGAALSDVALDLELGVHLLLGKGEERSGGRTKPSILADAFEAVVGAVYVDGGFKSAAEFVNKHFAGMIKKAVNQPGGRDYKTLLQESAARAGLASPSYQVRPTGPHHNKVYFATVVVGENLRGSGQGPTIKQAQQQAARVAWEACVDQDGASDV